jgi:hypothetical protein
MALLQALTAFAHLPRGFRNRDLRPHVAALFGSAYTTSQMTYDLRRLRLKGLIHRIPQSHRYTATTCGLKAAFFYSKLYLRILRPNWTALLADDNPVHPTLSAALNQLETAIERIYADADFQAA